MIGTKTMQDAELKDQQHCETLFDDCIATFGQNDNNDDEKDKEKEKKKGESSSVDINMNVSDPCDYTGCMSAAKWRKMWEAAKMPELPKIPSVPKIDALFNVQ